ncbi:MAG: ABC transporter family substrate-binding protein, partial [Sciscionella sp.]
IISALALIAGSAMLATACGSGGGGSGTGSGSGGANSAVPSNIQGWATSKGESNGSFTAPKVPVTNKTVTLVTDKAWNAYNNGTADAVSTYNGFIDVVALRTPFMLDGNNKVVLDHNLMESVKQTSDSPQTIVWKINPKAVWSDGAPVSCHDFYLHWLANAGLVKDFNTGGTTGYDQMKAPVCSDNDKTVTTTFTKPYQDWKSLFDVTTNALMPSHILEQATGIPDITKLTPTSNAATLKKAADFWNKKWQGFNPKYDVSDGQYMITDYQQDQSITLSRNPKWWGNKGGPAKIVVKFVADLTAQAQALQNGEVQVQYSAQPDADGSSKMKALSSQGIDYAAQAGLSYEHLDLQLKRPIFQDIAVRKAFFQCVNRNELVDKLIKPIQSDAKPANSVLFFPGEPGIPDNYTAKSTGDANQAKKTLEAAGWKMQNGVMMKNGKPLTFSISHTDIPRRTQTVQLIQSECKKAGFDIKDHTDPNFLNGPVAAGQYDVALFAWSQAPFKSSSIAVYKSGGGENWQGLSSPAADKDFQQALAQTSQAAAKPYYLKADKAISQTYATLPLFNTPNQWALNSSSWDGPFYQGYNGVLWDVGSWTPAKK